MVNTETSKVPPPKSKTKMFYSYSPFLYKPYAMAAAVCSFKILTTLSPEMAPASFVAYL
jgi:hypothetical protein